MSKTYEIQMVCDGFRDRLPGCPGYFASGSWHSKLDAEAALERQTVDWFKENGRHFCPTCLAAERAKSKIQPEPMQYWHCANVACQAEFRLMPIGFTADRAKHFCYCPYCGRSNPKLLMKETS